MNEFYRQQRKALKQKLFTIRRHVEGERVKMDKELKDLKKAYESLEGFTRWQDFPEKWDVGDPYGVKLNAFAFDEVTARNYRKAMGKGYDTIIKLDVPEYPGELLDSWHLAVLEAGLSAYRVRPNSSVKNLQAGYIVVTVGFLDFEDQSLELKYHIHNTDKGFGVTRHTSLPSALEYLEVLYGDDSKEILEEEILSNNKEIQILVDVLKKLDLIKQDYN